MGKTVTQIDQIVKSKVLDSSENVPGCSWNVLGSNQNVPDSYRNGQITGTCQTVAGTSSTAVEHVNSYQNVLDNSWNVLVSYR